MLSPLDDYPVHQISRADAPRRHLGPQLLRPLLLQHPRHRRRARHRRGAVLRHRRGPVPQPQRGRRLRVGASGATTTGWCAPPRPSAPTGWTPRSGPIRVEVIKGLEQVRVILEPNEWGIELDAVYDGFCRGPPRGPPLRPPVLPGHLRLDPLRPGRRLDRHPQGGRPRGRSSPPTGGGAHATARGASARWASPSPPASGPPTPASGSSGSTPRCASTTTPWSPSSRSGPSGERIMQDAHRVFPIGSGRERRVAGATRARAPLRPGDPDRHRGHPLLLRRPRARRRPRSRSRRCWPSPCCWAAATGSSRTGSTGCTRATWWSRARTSRRPTRTTPTWGLTEYAARFTCDGQVGYGMFECAVMGAPRAVRLHRLRLEPGPAVRSPGAGRPVPARCARRTTPTGRRRRRANSCSDRRVQGTLCSHRRRRSSQKPPVVSTPRRRCGQPHGGVGPLVGRAQERAHDPGEAGQAVADARACRPSRGAWRGSSTPGARRAPHPLVHEDQLGPLGPGVGHRAVVVVRSHLQGRRGRSAGCTCPPTRPGSTRDGAAARRAGSSSPVSRYGAATWDATVSSMPAPVGPVSVGQRPGVVDQHVEPVVAGQELGRPAPAPGRTRPCRPAGRRRRPPGGRLVAPLRRPARPGRGSGP